MGWICPRHVFHLAPLHDVAWPDCEMNSRLVSGPGRCDLRGFQQGRCSTSVFGKEPWGLYGRSFKAGIPWDTTP